MSGRTASAQKGPAAVIAASPPIVDFARLVGHFVAASYGIVSRTTVAVALTLLAPISLLYGPIAYLLAPVIVLSQVLLDVFLFTPYAIITSVARNVYPIYVQFTRLRTTRPRDGFFRCRFVGPRHACGFVSCSAESNHLAFRFAPLPGSTNFQSIEFECVPTDSIKYP